MRFLVTCACEFNKLAALLYACGSGSSDNMANAGGNHYHRASQILGKLNAAMMHHRRAPGNLRSGF